MKSRKAKLIVNKSGGTAGTGGVTFRVTLPSAWVRKMKLDEDSRNIKLRFNGKEITIINNEEEIKMLEKLTSTAKVEIEKEMDRLGFIDDSDRHDRFLDGLAKELVEKELLQGNDDIDLYYEKEEEIEELSEELLELIKEYVAGNYSRKGSTNERGDYSGCYYKDKEGYKKWSEIGE